MNKKPPSLKLWVNKQPRKRKNDGPPMAKLHPSRQRVMMRTGWSDYRLIEVPSIGESGVIFRQCVEEGEPPDILILLTQKALVDGIITEKEASTLNSWLQNNVKRQHNVLSLLLFDRIRALLVDGYLDDDEQEELLFFLKTIQWKPSSTDYLGCPLSPPFDDPPPPIDFDGKVFCLLGQFAFGPRCECVAAIQELGGKIEQKVTSRVDYIVIGTLCTRAWLRSPYSRKIQYALAMKRERKKEIQIVSEAHWAQTVFNFEIV
ncbi:MAG: BRCT domain-containing protein [Desulfobulbus sp.]